MRNGHKPRRDQSAGMDEALIGLPEADPRSYKSVAAAPDDRAPGIQLGLDALDPLDEPAEVLIRVSTDALAGEDDLVNEEPDETEEEYDAKLAADVQVTGKPRRAAPARTAVPPPAAPVDAAQPEIESEPERREPEPEEDDDFESDGANLVLVRLDESDEAAEPAGDVSVVETAEIEIRAQDDIPEVAGEDLAAADDSDFAPELPALPLPYEPAEALPVDDPVLQIRLARVHLKTGSFHMARAELEALAGRDQLDTPGFLNLAEARWRTGDLHGAAEAAAAYIADGGDEALCYVIAAEAAATVSRQDEARGYVEQALERHLFDLDPVFAGLPRRAVWTSPNWNAPQLAPAAPEGAAPAEVVEQAPTQPDGVPELPESADREASLTAREESVAAREANVTAREAEVVAEAPVEFSGQEELLAAPEPQAEPARDTGEFTATAPEPAEPEPPVAELAALAPEPAPEPPVAELAALEPEPAPEPPVAELAALEPEPEPAVAELAVVVQQVEQPVESRADAPVAASASAVEAGHEVTSGMAFLEAGDPMMAALHFAVAVRLAPVSANAVLEAIGDRQDLPLQLVRGDALKALGMEGDAGKAYLSVASALGVPKPAAPEAAAPAIEAATPVEPSVEPSVELAAPEPPQSVEAEPAEASAQAEPATELPQQPVAVPPTKREPPVKRVPHELPPIRWD